LSGIYFRDWSGRGPMGDNGNGTETLEAQVRALKDLIEVAEAVVSSLDLDAVLKTILDSAMRFAGIPAGTIALYDDLRREFTLHAYAGVTRVLQLHRWELVPGGLTEYVLDSRSIVYIEDLAESQFAVHSKVLKDGVRSVICIPLVLQNRILGIIYLDDFVPRKFDREKMDLLSVLASFAAMSIENAKLHNRTRLMAITDGLTGLYNHRYFHQIVAQELDRARRYEKPLSLIMMDVDDFKKFNDRYGHKNGDRVLATVGEIINETLRSVDCAFRYGGEEFVVLLPETRLDSAVEVAERLRENIETEATVRVDDIGENVTVSIGVACFPFHGDTKEKLLDHVDELLYRAKSHGKNQVHYESAA
jgi:diguanylate cyclase (GGDEF)-like protein